MAEKETFPMGLSLLAYQGQTVTSSQRGKDSLGGWIFMEELKGGMQTVEKRCWFIESSR